MLFTKYADNSVELYGDIEEGFYNEFWNYIPKDEALTPLENFLIENKGVPVKIMLTSDGGSYFTGQVFSSLFIEHGKVDLVLRGAVASAATLMVVAARTVKMYTGASMMIHRVQGVSRGTGEQLIKAGQFFQQLDTTVISSYVDAIRARGKLINGSVDETTKKIKKLYDAETWLSGQDALDLGFVDGLLSGAGENSGIPIFNITNYKPKQFTEEQEKAFLEAVVQPKFGVLSNFEGFATQVRAYKSSAEKGANLPKETQKAGVLQKVKGLFDKAIEGIKNGIDDSFGDFFTEKETDTGGAPEAQSENNPIQSQNQNPESETMTEELKQMLADIKQQNEKLIAAQNEQIEQLKAQIVAKNEAQAQAEKADVEAKAAETAEAEKIKQKQADLAAENARKAGADTQAPTVKPAASLKEGRKLTKSADNFGIFAQMHPETAARVTQTAYNLPKRIIE